MKLISWNVAGRVKKIEEQVKALARYGPDIVALQEVIPNSAGFLWEQLAERAGLPYVVHSFALAPGGKKREGPERCGELIASRWPVYPTWRMVDGGWSKRLLSVVIETPAGQVELHNAYIPCGATNDWVKIETLDGIYNLLAVKSSTLRILCGDFNTPQEEREDGQVITWGQRIRPNGEVIPRNQDSPEEWNRGERQIVTGLAEFDLPDVFSTLNGYGVQESSWVSHPYTSKVGRRFDNIFASSTLIATSCRYLHPLRENGLSDHSAIEADFQPD